MSVVRVSVVNNKESKWVQLSNPVYSHPHIRYEGVRHICAASSVVANIGLAEVGLAEVGLVEVEHVAAP